MWEVLASGRLTGSETEFLTYILDVGSTENIAFQHREQGLPSLVRNSNYSVT